MIIKSKKDEKTRGKWLHVCNHGLLILTLSIGHDAQETCIRHGYALKIAMFACAQMLAKVLSFSQT